MFVFCCVLLFSVAMNETKYKELNIAQKVSETDSFTIERYRQFQKFFPEGAVRILDIGCNTGRGGAELKRINPNYVICGLDIVEERLNQLPRDVYDEVILGSTTDIPCDDNVFDVAVAGEFIEHLYTQDVSKTLAEIFRILKVGGRFLLTTPNPHDIKRKLRHETILGDSHVSQHFPHILKIELMMVGFSHVRIFGSGKVTRYLGYRFPFRSIYGSYLAVARKY